MPTTKPRYVVTDAGEMREMLDAAQRRWPQVTDRKALLLLLAKSGREAIEREGSERRAAAAETAGVLGDVYEPGELERLREEWPR
jgi:mannose/cellobiose epimerase-like protein (N-acyl-D-glucosamine 2-epimerase family)